MQTTLYDLLKSKWLFTDQAYNASIPYLVSMLRGETPKQSAKQLPKFIEIKGETEWDFEDGETETTNENRKLVGVLGIKSAITKYSQWCGPMGTKEMRNYMESWKNNDDFVAVVLDIDSGGGQVSGTPEFAEYIANYPKPVIAYTDGMMASAAYWLGAAADEIVANQDSDAIGSIGTMVRGFILDGIIEKEGGQVIEEYATKSTEKNKSFRELKKGNVEPYIKEELDPINDKFHNRIKKYRPNVAEEVFTGAHYIEAQEAQEKGLVDHINNFDFAVNRALELADLNSKNDDTMSKNNETENNYPKLANVLGSEIKTKGGLLFGAKTINLSESQLEALEAALPDEADKNALTTLESAVEKAVKDAGLEAESKKTATENVAFLAEKVNEYGSDPGDEPTQVKGKGDKVEKEEGFVDEIAKKVDTTNI